MIQYVKSVENELNHRFASVSVLALSAMLLNPTMKDLPVKDIDIEY